MNKKKILESLISEYNKINKIKVSKVSEMRWMKDKIDFLRFYEKPKERNELKEVVAWREINNEGGLLSDKVEIKIYNIESAEQAIKEINKIHN